MSKIRVDNISNRADSITVPVLEIADLSIKNKSILNYDELRLYDGNAEQIRVIQEGIQGIFFYDSSDTVQVDDGENLIVSNNGKRWKRLSRDTTIKITKIQNTSISISMLGSDGITRTNTITLS